LFWEGIVNLPGWKRSILASARAGAALSLLALPLALISAKAAGTLQAQQEPAPDNTKTNQRDKEGTATADQRMTSEDREITKKIRQAVHNDKSLSTYAHNVKIITQGGKVTLRGPVRSEEEKTNIAAKATAVAGDGNVDNQLEIAPQKQ
jgi:osmotically-inducible protein OsmY